MCQTSIIISPLGIEMNVTYFVTSLAVREQRTSDIGQIYIDVSAPSCIGFASSIHGLFKTILYM